MKYKVGMYGGAFSPLHLGHVNDIIVASNQCEKLYVVVSLSDNKEEININERLKWLNNITKDMDNVEVIKIEDHSKDKENTNWTLGRDQVLNQTGPLDVVFAGDDYKGTDIWQKLYPNSKIEYLSREEINISSTKIRENPYKYYDYLPKIVQEYYVKKVCIVGTESCGKTTLIKNLAKYYNTSYVEEAGRFVCEDAGGIDNMTPNDYFDILFRHKELERMKLKNANKVLLIDTDSLITLFFYKLGYENTSEYNEKFELIAEYISQLNNYDLYLFLEPDVDFIDDGYRLVDANREENSNKIKKLLDKNNINYYCISGNYQQRYEKAKEKINKIIKNIKKD